jgi:uncharacterized protein
MLELRPIDRSECLRLLDSHRFGRVAFSVNGQAPTIRPINYVFDEPSQSIVFRTAAGSKLHGVLGSRKAAFEIDDVDLKGRTGWSVIVTGKTEEIVNPAELRRLERAPLDPWAPGDKAHCIRIRAWTVSGRRIMEPEGGVDSGPQAPALESQP